MLHASPKLNKDKNGTYYQRFKIKKFEYLKVEQSRRSTTVGPTQQRQNKRKSAIILTDINRID